MDNKASFNIPTTTTITTTTTSTTTNTPQANSPSNEPIIFVIPGGGGKTTLCTNTKYLDIDQFWDINAIHEKDMISRWEEAKRVNNQEVVNEIIEECVLYKAKKCKDNIIKYEKPVVLVQSVGQARIITTNMENVYCLVPDKSLHESNMQVRGDPEWIKEICRKQRDDIIGSGLAIKYYMKMEDLSNLALECLNYRDESYM